MKDEVRDLADVVKRKAKGLPLTEERLNELWVKEVSAYVERLEVNATRQHMDLASRFLDMLSTPDVEPKDPGLYVMFKRERVKAVIENLSAIVALGRLL